MPSEASNGSHRAIRLGDDFEFDLRLHRLFRSGSPIKLQRIPSEALALLVEHRGETVSRDQLAARIWGNNVFLDVENSLNIAIRKLRQALNDDPEQPRFIETVTGQGYRLIAPVGEISDGAEAVPSASGLSAPFRKIRPPNFRRWLFLSAVATVLIVGGGWIYRSRIRVRTDAARHKEMLAVLPFENLSEGTKPDYFSDGLTEEMITQVGRLDPQRLGVIGRTSIMYYKTHLHNFQDVGRELGVQYVIEGSVRRDHEKARITVRLVRASDEATLWTDSFDRRIGDVLALQSEIAQQIGSELQIQVLGHGFRESTRPEVVEAYLHGRFELNHPDVPGTAREYFERTITLDPSYAPGYAGLADFYCLRGIKKDEGSEQAWNEAEHYATQALSLDPNSAETHTAIARIKLMHDWDWGAAREHALRALQLNPSSAEAHSVYALYLRTSGDVSEDLNQRQQAVAVDPYSTELERQLMFEHYFARDYQTIVTAQRQALLADPNSLDAHLDLCINLGRLSLFEESVHHCETSMVLEGHSGWISGYLREYREHGYQAATSFAAREELRELLAHPHPDLWELANVYVAAGMRDETFRTLFQGLQTHEPGLLQIRVDPDFDQVRDDPRYAELVREIGFPPQ